MRRPPNLFDALVFWVVVAPILLVAVAIWWPIQSLFDAINGDHA